MSKLDTGQALKNILLSKLVVESPDTVSVTRLSSSPRGDTFWVYSFCQRDPNLTEEYLRDELVNVLLPRKAVVYVSTFKIERLTRLLAHTWTLECEVTVGYKQESILPNTRSCLLALCQVFVVLIVFCAGAASTLLYLYKNGPESLFL